MWQSQVENEHYSTASGLIQLVIIGVQKSYGEVASSSAPLRAQGGTLRAGKKKEGPGIQRSRMRRNLDTSLDISVYLQEKTSS